MGTSWAVVLRSDLTAADVSGAGAGVAFEGGDREQLVDRRRLGGLLDEAVAGRERRHFPGADLVDEAIEVLAQPRVGAGAVGRLQEHVERLIELDPRLVEMTLRQFLLAGLVVTVRRGDQRRDWIGGGRRRRGLDDRTRSLGRGSRLRDLRFGIPTAPDGQHTREEGRVAQRAKIRHLSISRDRGATKGWIAFGSNRR